MAVVQPDNMAEPLICPFCGLHSQTLYDIQLHVEEHHTEDSPFVSQQHTSSPSSEHPDAADTLALTSDGPASKCTWVRCTRNGCGDYVLTSDIDEHLDLHAAMNLLDQDSETLSGDSRSQKPLRSTPDKPKPGGFFRSSISKKLHKRQSGPPTGQSNGSRARGFFQSASLRSRKAPQTLHQPRNPGRLGKQELGPQAFEKSMPDDVRRRLVTGAQPRSRTEIGENGKLIRRTFVPNETPGLIAALADLCTFDSSNHTTYLCHASVRHVQRIPCDGNFCGYWNTQMLLTYIQHMNPAGPQQIPNVLQIQDLVEQAWENGICSYGKIETGGVRNTRKWIGTHEALAFFTQIGVRVEALSFKDSEQSSAAEDLLDHIEALFMSEEETAIRHETTLVTQLPPIYLQRLGHSMTIVGLERKFDGSRTLLVFDPSFGTNDPMQKLLAGMRIRVPLGQALGAYRRTEFSLSRWKEFEIIIPHKITSPEEPPRPGL